MSSSSVTAAAPLQKLDNGVLAKIMNNHNIEKPKLQVLNIRNINTSQNQNDRYLILLSDGDYLESACLLLPNLNSYVRSQKLKKESIIQLDKYALNSIPNGKVLVIVELTIICTEYPKIGNPVVLTHKQQQAQQQQQSTTNNHQQQQQHKQQRSIFINANSKNDDIEEICKCSNCQDKNTIVLCYKMLGLNESATKDEVRSRYIYLANENNEKVHHDTKLAEKFDIMTKAYTLIMGMKNCESDNDDNVEKCDHSCNHSHHHTSTTTTTTTTNGHDDDNDSQKSKSSSSTNKSKIKIPLEDFLQYAWLKAADECSYDTDSDSECDIGFHRRKNRNPKAFYQQMKKSNKTLSIKAMKKRAKEVQTIQNNEKATTTNTSKTKDDKSSNETTTTTTKLNNDKKIDNKNKNQTITSKAMEKSSSSEIKITIKKEIDLKKDNTTTEAVAVANNTQMNSTTTTTSKKKKKNKKKKNKNNQQNENVVKTVESQTTTTTTTTKIALPPPPPPPPPPVTAILISELKSDNKLPSQKCCSHNHNENESDVEEEGVGGGGDEEDESEEGDEGDDDDYEDEEEEARLKKKAASDVAVSTIATNIENLTNAFIPKDDTPESKNLRDKLKNIVSSLQSLQKVIDTQDLKIQTKFASKVTSFGEDGKKEVTTNEEGSSSTSSGTNQAHVITENFIKNIEKLMLHGPSSNNSSSSSSSSSSSTSSSSSSSSSSTTNSALFDSRIKSATLDLSSKELKKSHDSILSELIETRNEINNARNRKLLKHQQYYQHLTENSDLSSSIIDQLNDLKKITFSTCMSQIEDFKINYKLLASNEELVLSDDGKLAKKQQDAHSELLSHIDNVQTLSSLATESLKNHRQIVEQQKKPLQQQQQQQESSSSSEAVQQQQQQQQQQNNSKKKNKKNKQQQKKEENKTTTTQSSQQSIINKQPQKLTTSSNENSTSTNKKKKNKNKSNNNQPSSKDKNKSIKLETSEAIPIIIKPSKIVHSLSDLDSFSLDSVSSSMNSLVANAQLLAMDDEDDDAESLGADSAAMATENENDEVILNSNNNNNNNNNNYDEDEDDDDTGDGWIQVKKPTRNATLTNDSNNSTTATTNSVKNVNQQKSEFNFVSSNQQQQQQQKHNNDIRYVTSKSVNHDLNKKASSSSDVVNHDNNVWNRSNSLSSTNSLMPKASSSSSNNNNKSVETNKQRLGNAILETNNNTSTADSLVDLIPKSIDEEEIMLRKALELSLKDSEDKSKQVELNKPPVLPQQQQQQKKFDCIDDFSTDIDVLPLITVKNNNKQKSKSITQSLVTTKQNTKTTTAAVGTKQTTKTAAATPYKAPVKSESPVSIIIDNKTPPPPPPSTTQSAPLIRIADDKQKKSINLSNSYTNGMTYAAKSAMKLSDSNTNTKYSSTTTPSSSSSFILSEEFPPVGVYNSTAVAAKLPPTTTATSISRPTAASLFANSRVNSKTNPVKIPTQTVAPLLQQQQQQHETIQSRSLSPIKKVSTTPSLDVVTNNLLPDPFVRPLSTHIESATYASVSALLEPSKSPFDAIPLISSKSVDFSTSQQRKQVPTNVAKPLYSEFESNGIDLPIDSSSNAPHVDSPKKAVGFERPIVKAIAVVPPTTATGTVSATIPVRSPPSIHLNPTKPAFTPSVVPSQLPHAYVQPMQHIHHRDTLGGLNNENIPPAAGFIASKTSPPPDYSSHNSIKTIDQPNKQQQQTFTAYDPLNTVLMENLFINQINTASANIQNNNSIRQMFKDSQYLNNEQQQQQQQQFNPSVSAISGVKSMVSPVGTISPGGAATFRSKLIQPAQQYRVNVNPLLQQTFHAPMGGIQSTTNQYHE